MDGLRRDVNREKREGIEDKGFGIETVAWRTLLGAHEDMTMLEMKKRLSAQ
jgi:hypothetical protein